MDKLKTHSGSQFNNLINNNYPLIIGLFIRVFLYVVFSQHKFVYPDEMSFLYNCKTLIESGTDALGQTYPIYFNTWLVGGHSPLPIYISSIAVKLFGINFFALKLPSLILGCITFVYFSKLIKLLIKDTEKQKTIILFEAFCMGSICTSTFLLDCWWMNYFITIGLYYFYYGIINKKKRYLYLSTFVFSLSLYCYIASVLIIPLLLVGLYISEIKKKNISFTTAFLNAIEAMVVAGPFIVFGLVALGKIKPFEICNITFPDMSLYTRNSYVAFNIKGMLNGFIASMYNYSCTYLFSGMGLDLGIIACVFAALVLFNKVKPKFNHDIKADVIIPFILPFVLFIAVTSTELAYRIGSFVVLVSIPLFSVLSDVINTKFLKRVLFSVVALILVANTIYACASLNNKNYYAPVKEITALDMPTDIYINVPETEENEDYSSYEEAWTSYKFRIDVPEDNYCNFKEEQLERYYGNNTVQISDRILLTKNYEDINNDHYLFTLNKDNYKGRKLLKTFKNFGAHLNTWYLYSPIS